MQCGRVGSRLLFIRAFIWAIKWTLFCLYPLRVCYFRAWRKLFPEWFVISAHGESHFPKSLAFPRSAKVISRMVWCFRAWRKLFPEWFVISAHGESHFPNSLWFPRMAKVVSQKVWSFRAWRKSFPEWFEAFSVRGNICEKLGCVL